MLRQEEGGEEEQEGKIGTNTCSAGVSFCPSFNSYSADNSHLVDIAAKVSEEEKKKQNDVVGDGEEEEEFEFVSLSRYDVDGPQLFFDGQIRQVFPVFNRDLLFNGEDDGDGDVKLRYSLKKLFIDEQNETTLSSSSSEADELERVPEETYCLWSPKKDDSVQTSPFSKKSKSTGSSSTSTSSKRWEKFRDLLKRSNSDGKDPFVILSKSRSKSDSSEKNVKIVDKGKGKKRGEKLSVSAHEKFYVKNRAIKEGDKKKSYLPYRQDLLGFFANVGTVGKTFPPYRSN